MSNSENTFQAFQANLKYELLVNKNIGVDEYTSIPDWAKFMMWSGWWMSNNKKTDTRIYMVMLLPQRHCCSAFCALGSLFANSTKSITAYSWDEFKNLEDGCRVYLLINNADKLVPVEGIVGGYTDCSGTVSRIIRIDSKIKNLKDLSIFIFQNSIDQYKISLSPHASRIKLGILANISNIYKKIINNYQETWIISNITNSLVVTNKAMWNREIEDINFLINDNDDKNKNSKIINFSKLLLSSDANEPSAAHTHVVSSNIDISDIHTKVVILDGPEALTRWEAVGNSNVIILLSQPEYNPESEGILSMHANFRSEHEKFNYDDFDGNIPCGVEVMFIELDYS